MGILVLRLQTHDLVSPAPGLDPSFLCSMSLECCLYAELCRTRRSLEDWSFSDSLLHSFSVISCTFNSIVYSFILQSVKQSVLCSRPCVGQGGDQDRAWFLPSRSLHAV